MHNQIHWSIRGMHFFIGSILGLALLCFGPESSEAAQLPTLPQAFIDTTYSPPVGNTIAVNAGGNLQAAIDNALPGDTIVLQAGATFTGPFTLPEKTGSAWIYIQSSASLPPPGTRVGPADAASMPKIVGGGSPHQAVKTNSRAHHFRFVGIEFMPASGQTTRTLIEIGGSENSIADLPHDIIFDRCYVHGNPNLNARRGIAMNGTSIAVVDSYISDFKEQGADSQALWTYSTPGPLKIVNNFLEAAGENFMSGGADPRIVNMVPSDIEIRQNHFYKPLSWKGMGWSVKNLIEFKNAQRILVEGNIFENSWSAGQIGALINAKSVNQDGGCSWCVTRDLTFRYNKGINVEVGFQLAGAPQGPAVRMHRVLIEHNVLNVGQPDGGNERLFQIVGGPNDLTIRNNTAIVWNGGALGFSENNPATDGFDFRDNIVSKGSIGFKGSGSAEGTGTLTMYYTNWTFLKNAIIGASSSRYPADNFFPGSNAAVGFMNLAGGDYRLSTSSPYKNAGSDGRDLGADINALEAAISGGPPSSTPLPAPSNLRVQ